MAWPTALTTNADILTYIFEQGLTRLLENGNDFTALHQGVAEEVRLWLEGEGGVNDADDIQNYTDFKSAACHLFVSKVLRTIDPAKAQEYSNKFIALMRTTRRDIAKPGDPLTSGTMGKVVVIRQGKDWFGKRRANQVFRLDRGN